MSHADIPRDVYAVLGAGVFAQSSNSRQRNRFGDSLKMSAKPTKKRKVVSESKAEEAKVTSSVRLLASASAVSPA